MNFAEKRSNRFSILVGLGLTMNYGPDRSILDMPGFILRPMDRK